MKKIKFTGRLSLNKETVSKLNDEQLNQVNGGSQSDTGSGCTGTRYCPSLNCPPRSVTCYNVTNTLIGDTY